VNIILSTQEAGRRHPADILSGLFKNRCTKKYRGGRHSLIFSEKNKPQQVLRFLDNESFLKDELKIISSLPDGH
jgi:hypothetical protein